MEIRQEFWVSDPPEDVVRKIRLTLQKIGVETALKPGVQVDGRVAFGVQSADLRITWSAEDDPSQTAAHAATTHAMLSMPGTRINVLATSEKSESAARSAADRFRDAFEHYDRAGYQHVDRSGVLPLVIAGSLILFLILFFTLMRNAKFRQMLPSPHPQLLPSGPPLPTPAPEETQ